MMLWIEKHRSAGELLPQFLLKLFGHNSGGHFPLFSRCGQITREVNTPQTIKYSSPFLIDVIGLTNSPSPRCDLANQFTLNIHYYTDEV